MKFKNPVGAFFVTGIILLAVFYGGGLYPFGNGTISWCDMNQQAIPLLGDFKDILSGEGGLFLNLKNAGGMNFYGVFFFFLSSPFSFTAAFVSKADIPLLMNVLVVLKLCLAAFTAALVLDKIYAKLSFGVNGALGVAYALCGYGMLFYQNIMWLDIMYLFPLVILGAHRLITKQKPILLLVTLSMCVVLNYYISFMVFLFVILLFGVYALFKPETGDKTYLNLAFCGIFSLLITAVVWLPSLIQYFSSARGTGILENLKNSDFFAPYETTLPIILCSGVVLAAAAFAVTRLNRCDKQTKFLLVMLFLTSIPLVIEPANIMWHTGSYMSFPARYGFITAFVGIMLLAKILSECEFGEKTKKSILVLTAAIIFFFAFWILDFADNNVSTLARYVKTLWGDTYSLQGNIFIALIFTLLVLAIIFAVRRKILGKRVLVLALGAVIALQGAVSAKIYMVSAKESFDLQNYQSFLQTAEKIDDDGFYRVNFNRKFIDANMSGAAGLNSLAHYTSLNDANYMETAKQFGYSGYWMESGNWGGSIISDSLLSVKYTIVKGGESYNVAENPYYQGLGILVPEDIPEEIDKGNRLSALGKAFGDMALAENIVTDYDFKTAYGCNYEFIDGKHIITNDYGESSIYCNVRVGEKETLYFDCYNGFSNNLTESINSSFDVEVNGQLVAQGYPTQSNNGLLCLGEFEDQMVNITINVLKDTECTSFGVFGIKNDRLEEIVKSFENADLKPCTNGVSGEIKTAGKYFISLPYSEDYTVTLDGEEIPYTKALSGFMAVNVKKAGFLEIGFKPAGFNIGLIISLIFSAVAILYLRFGQKLLLRFNSAENIVFGIFMGGFAAVMILVYIIPIVASLWDGMI